MTQRSSLMTLKEINTFFEILAKQNPFPKSELHYTNHFTLLVAVILSAQSTDKGVNKATGPLFKIADTPKKILSLGEEKLKSYIKTIGLYNTKGKNIILMCQKVINEFAEKIPNTRQDLETLPGVGRKTANVVLNTAFGEPTIAVDTHIFRVSNRTGLAHGKTPLEIETKLLKRIPQKWQLHAHHWLILLGRYTCQARKPKCFECPIIHCCHYDKKTEEKT